MGETVVAGVGCGVGAGVGTGVGTGVDVVVVVSTNVVVVKVDVIVVVTVVGSFFAQGCHIRPSTSRFLSIPMQIVAIRLAC
jgi:hypothetical protein